MSTANVARDMDQLRRPSVTEKLNYVGSRTARTSAGCTRTCSRTVPALVVDGVLDPVAWSTAAATRTTPFSTRLHSAVGAQATLEEFFRLCDAGGPPARSALTRLRDTRRWPDKLKAAPMQFTDPETGEVVLYNYSFLIGDTLGAMYYSHGWPDFAGFLAFLEDNLTPVPATTAAAPFAAPAQRFHGRFPEFPRYRELRRGRRRSVLHGLGQSATATTPGSPRGRPPMPRPTSAASGRGSRAPARCGTGSTPIATWGPFTATTASPVLVVGNLFDPATRYQGAQTVARPPAELAAADGRGVGAHVGRSCRRAPTRPRRAT